LRPQLNWDSPKFKVLRLRRTPLCRWRLSGLYCPDVAGERYITPQT